jgi:hypothetical protein
MGRRELENLHATDELHKAYNHKIEALTQVNFEASTAAQNAHLAQVEKLQGEHKSRVDTLTA